MRFVHVGFEMLWFYQNGEYVRRRLALDGHAVDRDDLVASVDESRAVRRAAVHHACDHNLPRLLVRLDRRPLRIDTTLKSAGMTESNARSDGQTSRSSIYL